MCSFISNIEKIVASTAVILNGYHCFTLKITNPAFQIIMVDLGKKESNVYILVETENYITRHKEKKRPLSPKPGPTYHR